MQDFVNFKNNLDKAKLDAFFVSNPANIAYISHFQGISPSEREGFIVITRKNVFLLAYATYYDLIEKTQKDFKTIRLTPKYRLSSALNDIIIKEKIRSMGLEKNNVTLHEYDSLKTKLKVNIVSLMNFIEDFRVIKDKDEIEKLQKAALITDKAFEFILKSVKKGISEKELALKIEYFMKENADNIAFPPIVAFDKNSAIPHYMPSSWVKLKDKSLILFDIGAKYQNYCADLSRVVFFGKPSQDKVKVFNAVNNAQNNAFKKLEIGVSGSEIDSIARNHITSCGFPEFLHGTGHGVGIEIHENPRLSPVSSDKLLKNMVFTVEPGIYLKGKFGVRIEDLLVLKNEGPTSLSKAPKELIIL